MSKLKIRKIGSALGVIIPKVQLDKLNLVEGNYLFSETVNDHLDLSPYDPDLDKELEYLDQTCRKFRHAFKALSKL